MADTSTWEQLQAMFAPYVDCMKNVTGGNLDLSNCDSVRKWGQEIYKRITEHSMPPPSGWDQPTIDQFVSLYDQWLAEGTPCP
jgi:hypothetical protein